MGQDATTTTTTTPFRFGLDPFFSLHGKVFSIEPFLKKRTKSLQDLEKVERGRQASKQYGSWLRIRSPCSVPESSPSQGNPELHYAILSTSGAAVSSALLLYLRRKQHGVILPNSFCLIKSRSSRSVAGIRFLTSYVVNIYTYNTALEHGEGGGPGRVGCTRC